MKKLAKRMLGLMGGIAVIYLLILVHPNPLFAYESQHRNFEIHSDLPISESVKPVIDDAILRLEQSELYKPQAEFQLYLCNKSWRFRFFTRNGNAGGVVNFLFSPNIFIREHELATNQLIPPKSWKNSLADRHLSYFIAHEPVHSLQREWDPFLIFKAPIEVVEGYAEYVAKSPTRNLPHLKEDFGKQAPSMNPGNGLYVKYHLYIAYLIEEKGYRFSTIVEIQPELEKTLAEIMEK